MLLFDVARRHWDVWRAAWDADRKRPALRRSRDELAFLPAALEVVETPASPLGRGVAAAISAFFIIALLWASLGEIDIHATAQGKIVPSGRVKTIQPMEIGTVKAIHVEDGRHVQKGEPLIDLDTTTAEADSERLTRDKLEAAMQVAVAKALLEKDPERSFAPPAEASAVMVAVNRQLLRAKLMEHRAGMAALNQEYDQRQAESRSVQADLKRYTDSAKLIGEREQANRELVKHGYAARNQYLELKQELGEREQEREAARHRQNQIEAAIKSVEERRRQTGEQFRTKVLTDMAEAQHKVEGLEKELIKTSQRHTLLNLTAPVDGVVQQLAVHTLGGVVTAAQPLMVIVPDGEGLEVEAFLPNKDAGFVRERQKAEIKVETFPFTRYGTLPGEVVTLSKDTVQQQQDQQRQDQRGNAASSGGPSYGVRVKLERTVIMVDGQPTPLTPGMAVTAEIKIGTRRIIDYLLSPIIRYREESFRER